MPPSNEDVKRVAFILDREQVASMRRVAEKGYSRKLDLRCMEFSELRGTKGRGPGSPYGGSALFLCNNRQKAIEEPFDSSPRTTAPPNGSASPYAELAVYTRSSGTV